MSNREIALNLLNKTIEREGSLNSLGIPSVNYPKTQLRRGTMARVQRKENEKYKQEVNRQKSIYKKQKSMLYGYIEGLNTKPRLMSNGDIEEEIIEPPMPSTKFFGIPNIKQIRIRGGR